MSELNLRFLVATVAGNENPECITLRAPATSSVFEMFFLTAETQFRGSADDKTARNSLRPGMSVNIWAANARVVLASPNYR